MKWVINPLDSSLDRSYFDCGNSYLNEFLKKYASQNAKKGYALTFVATKLESNIIVGYYSVSASSIEFANLPDPLKKGLPRYPAPVMLIGQLAVDKTLQAQGLGKILLMHALTRAVRVSSEMAIFAVRVDAVDEKSQAFYLKYGFIPFQDEPLSLLLPIKTIINSKIAV
jgi:GNAT superfamily N-acetyltransferase